jgi:hypothetical protein
MEQEGQSLEVREEVGAQIEDHALPQAHRSGHGGHCHQRAREEDEHRAGAHPEQEPAHAV